MPEPTPIPEADSLVIPWPVVRPMGFRLSAAGLEQAWKEIVTPLIEEDGSIEMRCLAAALRAVFDGMHGIVTASSGVTISRQEFAAADGELVVEEMRDPVTRPEGFFMDMRDRLINIHITKKQFEEMMAGE